MGTSTQSSREDFVGRENELAAALRELAGAAPMVLVQGPPGIGKSALATEISSRVAGRWRVARGSARELEVGQPFAVLAEAMGGLRTVSAGATPGSVEAWLDLLDRVSAREHTMLLLEDLHWADVGTLAVLARLARGHDAQAVAVLATARSNPQRPEVDAWVSSLIGSACVLELQALDGGSVTQQVSHLIGLPPGPRLQAEVGRAAGNPAMVRELVSGMQAAEALHRSPTGSMELTGEGWTGSVATSILNRLGFLTTDARTLLTHCSVLGGRFPVTELVALTGRGTAELMPLIEEMNRAGLLFVDDDHLAFTHDLVRDAVYQAVPAPVRFSAHHDAARRLGEAGASPVVVGEHLLRSARAGDSSAVDRLREAAKQVLDEGPGLALQLLDAALRGLKPLDPRRRALQTDRAEALLAAGRLRESAELCRDLLEVGQNRSGAPRLWEIRTHVALAAGQLDVELVDAAERSGEVTPERIAVLDCYRLLGDARSAVSPDPTTAARRAAARDRLGPAFYRDSRRVLELSREAVNRAREGGEAVAEANALCMVSFGLHDLLELEEYDAVATRAVRLAEASGHRLAYAMYPHATAAFAAYQQDRHDAAADIFAAGLATAQALGDDNYIQLVLVTGAGQHLARGDWDAALADAEAGEILAREIDARAWVEPSLVRAQVALHREGPIDARVHLAHAVRLVEDGTPNFESGGTLRLEMMILEREGAQEESTRLALDLWADLETLGLAVDQAPLAPTIVRLARELGRSDIVESAVKFAEAATARNPGVPSLRSWAMRSRALAEADPDLALEGLRQARCSLRRPDLAHAATEAALLLAGAGRGVEARASAHEALDIWGELHAVAEASLLRAQFRNAGIVTGVRGRRSRPQSGWAALTPTEVRIARLAAEARSNPEIAELLVVSRRTVQTHIGNVLAKLAISSRRELVQAASQGRLEQLGSPAG